MSASASLILVESEQGWTLFTPDGRSQAIEFDEPPADPDAASAKVLEQIHGLAPARKRWSIIAAPAARSVLVAPLSNVPTGNVGRTDPHEQLAFAVEEEIPWSAEDFVASSVGEGDQRQSFSLRVESWQPLLDQFRNDGQRITEIVPAALLKFEGVRRSLDLKTSCYVMTLDSEGLHMIRTQGDHVSGWRFWPDVSNTISDELATVIAAEIAADDPSAALILTQPVDHLSESLSAQGLQVSVCEIPSATEDEWLREGAVSWMRRGGSPSLAVGVLADQSPADRIVKEARRCLVILLVFLLLSAGWFWDRTQRAKAAADALWNQQAELFRQTFPGTPVPAALSSRFDSEHRRAVGARGGEAKIDLPTPAIASLRAILEAHRQSVRSRFLEIQIRNGEVEIEGEFRSMQDVGRMINALEKFGLTIEPAATQKLDDTRVGARLRGSFTAPKPGRK